MTETLYGIYKGDKFIDVGTADELAARRGVQPATIRRLAQPKVYQPKRRPGLTAVKIKMDREEVDA